MKLINFFKNFRDEESGAVTVDWVVLTAAIVGLGIVVMSTVGLGIENLASSTVDSIEGQSVGYTSQLDAGGE
ncbi:pilus assembly protein [Rhodovulum adriaticum]|uniref:Flp pilus assembly pilin Flp n=1 Tax=Rhodovulum adriaticum TaxID=35804 RepID=A0A4R2NMJ4_RHOAD|nr:pilus assembly protein [Rhodovulum adriaticum]MBK1637134.1 pilus assembly protein [Rhodovulum adriaticum]TCP22732.1 hypothetical protein EV656_10531 [Rhodovulum adriaticum]